MSAAHSSFHPSLLSAPTFVSIKEEPLDYEEAVSVEVQTYEQTMRSFNETIASQELFIENTPAYQQIWLKSHITRREEELAARIPWLRRKEAPATTKYKQMQIGVRKKALEDFHKKFYEGAIEMRVMPGRAAKRNLQANVYKMDDDDGIKFLGVFQSGDKRKSCSKENKGRAKSNGKTNGKR